MTTARTREQWQRSNQRLAAKVRQMRAALRRAEWCMLVGHSEGCPLCLGLRGNGHRIDCALAAALRSR